MRPPLGRHDLIAIAPEHHALAVMEAARSAHEATRAVLARARPVPID
jgi:hypothetical protein